MTKNLNSIYLKEIAGRKKAALFILLSKPLNVSLSERKTELLNLLLPGELQGIYHGCGSLDRLCSGQKVGVLDFKQDPFSLSEDEWHFPHLPKYRSAF